MAPSSRGVRRVSLVIPVYFNEESLLTLVAQIKQTVAKIPRTSFEFVFVDDGSKDRSFETLLELRKKEPRIRLLRLARNFGSHSAIMAGLSRVQSDCQIIMSADLQDPPEVIPKFLAEWKKGKRIVVAIRQERHDPWLTALLANCYYAVLRLSFRNMPSKGFDIFLIDDKVRQFLVQIGSRNLSMIASILWAGYPMGEIPYTRQKRPFGKSRWNLMRRIKLAVDSLTAFSYLPILFIFIIGLLFLALSLGEGAAMLLNVPVPAPPGGSSFPIPLYLLGTGLTLVSLGIVAEYLWRNLEATRQFPSFLIDREIGFKK